MGNGVVGRSSPERDPQFQNTRWSVVMAARGGSTAEAHEALAALCQDYWYPLYVFVRRRGHSPEAAEDLVQGFFARLLEKGDLAAVDRRKGRFRSFLLASCSHYIANQADHDRAAKRGGGRSLILFDRQDGESRYAAEPAHELTPERLFERKWALTLLDLALNKLEAEMAAAGQSRRFEALGAALLSDGRRAPYASIAVDLGLSEEATRAAALRLRHRYRDLLREEIAGTLRNPNEIDDEIRDLFGAVSD